MPVITKEERFENEERLRRVCNTRFGYEHSLSIVLKRFLSPEDAEKALKAARNRNFDEFEKLVIDVYPDKVDVN